MQQHIALSLEKIQEKLRDLPGWVYAQAQEGQGKISKQFSFADFMEALQFVNALAPFCEKLDHHPDIHISYNRILFELSRFDIGGKVTEQDFTVAREIEQLYMHMIKPR